jgi:type 1 glutamine amidotransferase
MSHFLRVLAPLFPISLATFVGAAETGTTNLLIYTRTLAGRHQAIPQALASFKSFFAAHGITTTATEDPNTFSDEGLKPFQVVMFYNTTGNVLAGPQQQALVNHLHRGGGWVGMHAAAHTLKTWPWYAGLVGTLLKFDKGPLPGTLTVVDRTHPATVGLPEHWERTDQWFEFQAIPTNVRILVTVDGTKLPGYHLPDNYPVSWCHDYEGGRSFYTCMGHADYLNEPLYAQHILGAVRWAAHLDEPEVGH